MSDAMQENPQSETPSVAPEILDPEPLVLNDGTIIRKVFTSSNLIGKDKASMWAMNVPKGTVMTVGYIEGVVREIIVRDANQYDKDAGYADNICLRGDFAGNAYLIGKDGTAFNAEAIFVSRYYMERVRNIFKLAKPGDNLQLKLECEIGIEATGRGLGYAWTIREFDDSGRNERLQRKHRDRRNARLLQERNQHRVLEALPAPGAVPAAPPGFAGNGATKS